MAHARTAEAIDKPREKSTDAVYQKIREQILSNALRPGTQMLEQELVQLFGVSRTPVREALIRLQNEHLVQVIPRHGMRVRNISMTDLREVFEVQTSLECTAASVIASRKPGMRELKPLEKSCIQMEHAFANNDRDAWSAACESFYAHIVALSNNPRLMQLVSDCNDQVRRVRDLTLKLISFNDSQTRVLRAMIDALQQGEAALASSLCRQHRAHNLDVQIDALQRFRILDV